MNSDAYPAGVHALSTTAFSVNTWVHLVGVYDSSAGQIKLYVNGVLNDTQTCACAWNATGSFTIGRSKYAGFLGDWWQGRIDDVRVFKGALSAAQISYLSAL
jgi:hypothetical protein